MFSLLSYYGKKTSNDLRTKLNQLPPLSFPDIHQLTIYGTISSDWTLYTLDEKQTSLAEFRGKALFVNFWATWCEECTVEIPSIQRLRENLKDAPVAFVLVTNEHREVITRYLRNNPLLLPVLTSVKSPPSCFATPGLPATFVVSPTGFVVYRHFGIGKWDDPSAEKFLRDVARLSN
jgi:thiol-disulfide isomerase/thioredoxin